MVKLRVDIIFKIISAMPGTRLEIERRSGVCDRTIHKYLHALRFEREVYICGYMHQCITGRYAAIFDIGNHPDAEMPCRRINSKYDRMQYQRDYRRLQKTLDKQKVRAKTRRTLAKLKEAPNNPFSALFFKEKK